LKVSAFAWAQALLGSPSILVKTLEQQRDRWFLWYPVAIIAGVAAYFALPREPHMLVFVLAGMIASGCFWVLLRRQVSLKLLLTFCLLVGFVTAKVRTEIVQPKTLLATTPTAMITGKIVRVERTSERRSRLLVRVEKVDGIKPSALPELVRLTGKSPQTKLLHGDRITVKARLFPLPSPTRPRGYDFGRNLWFKGIGGTGFYYGTVKTTGVEAGSGFDLKRSLQEFRGMISRRIFEALPGKAGGVAVALITGDRGRLDKEVTENLRKAGLAHILAISGLHMSLVAGGMFWLVRALLALSGPLVLNFSIKKWAAVAGILTGAFYLVISGASIATQRAFVMLLIMFVAVLVDRPAISMRNLAIAALVIVFLRPEAVFSAGFQMSFMAVVGLIGFYEMARSWRQGSRFGMVERGPVWRWVGKGGGFFLAIATTTIIASIFTGLPAAYHFNKVAVFSLVGNIFALPIVSLMVMPGAILTILLMPLGLEGLGASVMQLGINLVTNHAQFVAELPNSQVFTPELSSLSAAVVALGMIWACLWRGTVKVLAVVPIGFGLLTIADIRQPDILVSKFGKNVAIRDEQGRLVLADARKSRFAAERWLVSNGEGVSLKQAAARSGWQCEANVCLASVKDKKIAYLKKGAEPQASLCAGLSVIISAEPLRSVCKNVPTRIDRFDLWRQGAHAVFLKPSQSLWSSNSDSKPKVETASSYRGYRPWVIKPIARRKILINPQQYKPYKPDRKNRKNRQRAASLQDAMEFGTQIKKLQYRRSNPASTP